MRDRLRGGPAAKAVRRLRRQLDGWGRAVLRDCVVNRLAGSALVPAGARLRVLRRYGLKLGRCSIFPGCWFGGSNVSIGDGTFVNRFCIFDNTASIEIGDEVAIGMQVMFVTSLHAIAGSKRRSGPLGGAPISVGDGAWIGTRATLLPGASVGAGCVVAAGSVVLGHCAANSLYAGVPARLKRELGSD